MSANGIRNQDYPLVPATDFTFSSGARVQLLGVTNVGDWDTLNIKAFALLTSNALGQELFSAVRMRVRFYQLAGSGVNAIPAPNKTFVIGGRNFCFGAQRLTTLVDASALCIRLPILSPWMDIDVDYDANQTNVTGANVAAWVSNEASYEHAAHFATGALFGNHSGDSLMGPGDYAGALGQPARGLIVAPGTNTIIELRTQQIGKGWFAFEAESTAGAALTGAELDVAVVAKASNDAAGTINEVFYRFPNAITGAQGGIPLTGFRQGVYVANKTAPARNIAVHMVAYPEFI